MTCPNCGHVYRIASGIPNMVSVSSQRSFLSLTSTPLGPKSCSPNTRLENNRSVVVLASNNVVAHVCSDWCLETGLKDVPDETSCLKFVLY